MGEWRYSSFHASTWHWRETSGQLHASWKQSSVPIEQEAGEALDTDWKLWRREESAATGGHDREIAWSCSAQPGDCNDYTTLHYQQLWLHTNCNWMPWTILRKYKQEGWTLVMQFKGTSNEVYHNKSTCSRFWQVKVHCFVNYSVELSGMRHLYHLLSHTTPKCCQYWHHTPRYCSVWPHATYICFLPAAQLFAASQLWQNRQLLYLKCFILIHCVTC
jgi:hypothetical protein